MKRNSKIWLWGMVTVAVLFGWHFLDVRAGASATGDGWLRGRYLWLGASVLGGLGIFGYALRKGGGEGAADPSGISLRGGGAVSGDTVHGGAAASLSPR